MKARRRNMQEIWQNDKEWKKVKEEGREDPNCPSCWTGQFEPDGKMTKATSTHLSRTTLTCYTHPYLPLESKKRKKISFIGYMY